MSNYSHLNINIYYVCNRQHFSVALYKISDMQFYLNNEFNSMIMLPYISYMLELGGRVPTHNMDYMVTSTCPLVVLI